MSKQPVPLGHLSALLEKLREAQSRADERAKATHARFNVFTTLLNPDDEVRLHTRFLHCLLDIKGCHDCGSLFLELFFETIEKSPGVDYEKDQVFSKLPPANQAWQALKESRHEGFGQIDILIEQPGFGIAIENKINSPEGNDQLERYASFLESRYSNGLVLFLTLKGEVSKTHKGSIPYRRISYDKHILAWLEKCLEKTHAIIPINQVILQYREVVRHLTGKIEPAFMKTISDFISQNPDFIRCRKEINDGIDASCFAIMDKLAEQLIEGIKKGMGDDFQVSRRGRFLADADGALIVFPPQTSILGANRFEIWIAKLSNKRGLIVGIVSKQNSLEIQHLLKRVKDKFNKPGSNYWMGDANELGRDWPAGWHVFLPGIDSDETLASLFDPETLTKKTNEACEEIKNHITLLEKFYCEASQATKVQS